MLVVVPPSSGSPPPPGTSFVTRDSGTGNLEIDGARYRFAGANVGQDIGLLHPDNGNAYGGTVDGGGYYLSTHSQIDAVLTCAVQMNATVVRVLAAVAVNWGTPSSMQPTYLSFQDSGLEPLDYALYQCGLRGLKMIIPLMNGASESFKTLYVSNTGGGTNDLFMTRPATITAFKSLIAYVLDHVNPYTGLALKNDPTVLCWETGNELTDSGAGKPAYNTWTEEIAAYIKVTKGAQQLVMDGATGITSDGTTFDSAQLDASHVDLFSNHSYDHFRTPAWMTGEANACHSHGKALVVGEYTWTDDTGTDGGHAFVGWFLDDLLTAFENQTNFDGGLFWDLLAPSTIWGDGFTLHAPPDATFNSPSLAQAQQRGTMLTDHALRMRGIAPRVFVSDPFTDTNGTAQTAHTGPTGATWAYVNGWTGPAAIQNNRLYAGATDALLHASGVPASSDYTVDAGIYCASLVSSAYAGVLARSYTVGDFYYDAYLWYSGSTATIYLEYGHPGTDTTLGSHVVSTPVVGSTHTLRLKLQGTALSVYWDDMTTPVIGPVTHTSLTAAGRAGTTQGGASTTTGFHIDTFTATDL